MSPCIFRSNKFKALCFHTNTHVLILLGNTIITGPSTQAVVQGFRRAASFLCLHTGCPNLFLHVQLVCPR